MSCHRPLFFKGNKSKIKEEDEVKLEPGEELVLLLLRLLVTKKLSGLVGVEQLWPELYPILACDGPTSYMYYCLVQKG